MELVPSVASRLCFCCWCVFECFSLSGWVHADCIVSIASPSSQKAMKKKK